jgi:hypothetical protein
MTRNALIARGDALIKEGDRIIRTTRARISSRTATLEEIEFATGIVNEIAIELESLTKKLEGKQRHDYDHH